MTDADLSIVNTALAQLGEPTVATLGGDPPPSRVVKVLPHLQAAIDAVLVRHGWLSALEYLTLEPSGLIPPNWRWPVHYVLPDGALRLWTVERTGGWERGAHVGEDAEGQLVIRAREGGPLPIAYVARRPAALLDPGIRDAAGWELAARACFAVTGSDERMAKLRQGVEATIASAMGADGQGARADEAMVSDRLGALRATAA